MPNPPDTPFEYQYRHWADALPGEYDLDTEYAFWARVQVAYDACPDGLTRCAIEGLHARLEGMQRQVEAEKARFEIHHTFTHDLAEKRDAEIKERREWQRRAIAAERALREMKC